MFRDAAYPQHTCAGAAPGGNSARRPVPARARQAAVWRRPRALGSCGGQGRMQAACTGVWHPACPASLPPPGAGRARALIPGGAADIVPGPQTGDGRYRVIARRVRQGQRPASHLRQVASFSSKTCGRCRIGVQGTPPTSSRLVRVCAVAPAGHGPLPGSGSRTVLGTKACSVRAARLPAGGGRRRRTKICELLATPGRQAQEMRWRASRACPALIMSAVDPVSGRPCTVAGPPHSGQVSVAGDRWTRPVARRGRSVPCVRAVHGSPPTPSSSTAGTHQHRAGVAGWRANRRFAGPGWGRRPCGGRAVRRGLEVGRCAAQSPRSACWSEVSPAW